MMKITRGKRNATINALVANLLVNHNVITVDVAFPYGFKHDNYQVTCACDHVAGYSCLCQLGMIIPHGQWLLIMNGAVI